MTTSLFCRKYKVRIIERSTHLFGHNALRLSLSHTASIPIPIVRRRLILQNPPQGPEKKMLETFQSISNNSCPPFVSLSTYDVIFPFGFVCSQGGFSHGYYTRVTTLSILQL